MSCLFGVDASWFTPSSSKSGDEITSLGDNTAGRKSFYTKIWKGGRGVFGGGGGGALGGKLHGRTIQYLQLLLVLFKSSGAIALKVTNKNNICCVLVCIAW